MMNRHEIEPIVFHKTQSKAGIQVIPYELIESYPKHLVEEYESKFDLKVIALGLQWNFEITSVVAIDSENELFFSISCSWRHHPQPFYHVFKESKYVEYNADLIDMKFLKAYDSSQGHFQTFYDMLYLHTL